MYYADVEGANGPRCTTPDRRITPDRPGLRNGSLDQRGGLDQRGDLDQRRLACELHDDIAHEILTSLNDLELHARYQTQDPQRASAKLEHARHHLQDVLERVRALAGELAGTNGTATAGHKPRPPDPVTDGAARRELAVVLAEALRNALIHSGARTINIQIDTSVDAISATVADDGCGFDVHRERQTCRGMGLRSMTERVELAGGDIRVDSAPLGHTNIDIWLPLRPPSDCAVRQSARP